MKNLLVLAASFLLLVAPTGAIAHALGEHYIWLDVEETQLSGDVEFNVRDLAKLLDFDLDPETPISEEAIAPYRQELSKLVSDRLAFIGARGEFPLDVQGVTVRSFEEGNFVRVLFNAGDGQAEIGRAHV